MTAFTASVANDNAGAGRVKALNPPPGEHLNLATSKIIPINTLESEITSQ